MRKYINRIPEGYSEGWYDGKRYGVSKVTFNGDRSFKIFADELGGNDFVSLNYYVTQRQEWLKPCEMPEEKVIAFLKQFELQPENIDQRTRIKKRRPKNITC